MTVYIVQLIVVFVEMLILTSGLQAQLSAESRRFTPREIETAYEYQVAFGQRMYHPIKAQQCFVGKPEFVAPHQGKEISLPCHFVLETKRHLNEILKRGAARYLFSLDTHHARLAVPQAIWEKKFRNVPGDQLLPTLLREPSLVAIYFTAERLAPVDQETGKVKLAANWRQSPRRVLGPYDGRPVVVLPYQPLPAGAADPEHYRSAGDFYFVGHWLGDLEMNVGGKAVTFDISFDDTGSENVP